MDLVASCPESSRLSVVVYGLPNKDCDGGFSNGNNSVQNGEDYKEFITNLTAIVGERKILYILEPDAVGLIANKGCAVDFGYQSNLANAISLLTENPNAEIYLDVGYWALLQPKSAKVVAEIVKELARTGRVKGIALNTSNYRSTKEISELCTNFQTAAESTDIHCIVDSSRNFQKFANASSNEWCNVEKAGIGAPPTNVTGYDNIDYLVYVKPPGDSDGQCVNHTAASMHGPQAGEFFNDHFVKLWNQAPIDAHKSTMKKFLDPARQIKLLMATSNRITRLKKPTEVFPDFLSPSAVETLRALEAANIASEQARDKTEIYFHNAAAPAIKRAKERRRQYVETQSVVTSKQSADVILQVKQETRAQARIGGIGTYPVLMIMGVTHLTVAGQAPRITFLRRTIKYQKDEAVNNLVFEVLESIFHAIKEEENSGAILQAATLMKQDPFTLLQFCAQAA